VQAGQARRRQNLAYAIGSAAGLLTLLALALPASEQWHARGPLISGHAELTCDACHEPAPGTYRQQVQANLRFVLGQRATPADFGRTDVGNGACLSCHDHPTERHPVYRFLEPRFAKVREELQPHLCVACHREHSGSRVTLTEIGYCAGCHEDTKLRKDPVDVPHERLIAADQWETCLGCHDFHGNHVMTTVRRLDEAIKPERIREYFKSGPSPFGEERHHQAPRERDDG
jgi:hypothetical protein